MRKEFNVGMYTSEHMTWVSRSHMMRATGEPWGEDLLVQFCQRIFLVEDGIARFTCLA